MEKIIDILFNSAMDKQSYPNPHQSPLHQESKISRKFVGPNGEEVSYHYHTAVVNGELVVKMSGTLLHTCEGPELMKLTFNSSKCNGNAFSAMMEVIENVQCWIHMYNMVMVKN